MIRVFQPIIQEYRLALYEGLAEKYGDEIEVWASDRRGQEKSLPIKGMRYDYNHHWHQIGPFVWQSGFSIRGLSRGDVIVVCGDIHQLSSLWMAFNAKIRGVKVIWWGHHRTASSEDCAVAVRLWIARRLSDVFLTYTKTGAKYLESVGFRAGRVFATGNTIDQVPIKEAIRITDVGSGTAPFLLCCGVMREKIHLELAIRALADARLNEIELVIIGDGPMKAHWQELANCLGVGNRIKWIPGTRDQTIMAPWFLNAKAFIYPGSIGLSILHSFSYGLPVITHGNVKHQMPEFEVMENGRTGVCFKEGDLDDLIVQTAGLISDEVRRQEMSHYCQEVAFNKYSMEQMIANFCEAIERAAVC